MLWPSLTGFLVLCASVGAAEQRPNVLLLAVDDLRPQLACYGQTFMQTPNIDRLAQNGLLFERAYCMVPTCGASRASLMTSVRPHRNRFVSHLAWADKEAPEAITLNTFLKSHGYVTQSLGKIFHHPQDSAAGWSKPAWRPKTGKQYHRPENEKLHKQRGKELGDKGRGPAFESADAPDADYPDAMIASEAIARLGELEQQDKPFFLAVGFMKPHLPFVCPQKYWDMYDHKNIELPATYHVPEDAPEVAIHNSGELRSYAGIPAKGPVDDETARNMIHGYYACVSFTDAQIGRVLSALHDLKLDESTIVIFWGDHGWNLGEHTLWCKHSCFETSMQIPLIIRVPGMAGGQRTAAIVESIDIYPTVCELTGLPVSEQLQGKSLLPIFQDPTKAGKGFAVGRFGPGDTIRTDRFRYTEYSGPRDRTYARMLYDHEEDPVEDENVVKQSANKATVGELSKQLQATIPVQQAAAQKPAAAKP